MTGTRVLLVASAALLAVAAWGYAQRQPAGSQSGSKGTKPVGDPALIDPTFASDTTVFVPSTQPIFIDGRRVEATNGGHLVVVNSVDGILVDGVVFMTIPAGAPEPTPAKAEDGFVHYVVARASELGRDVLTDGGSPEQARKSMLDFWALHGDSVTVTEGESSAAVEYEGRSVIVSFPGPVPTDLARRESQLERVLGAAEELVNRLNRGALILSTGSCLNVIETEDAGQVLEEIESIDTKAEVWDRIDGKVVYKGVPLAGGKYRLCIDTVKKLIENQ